MLSCSTSLGWVCVCAASHAGACAHDVRQTSTDIFARPASGGPESMAAAFGVPFLGAVPMDPTMLASCETGVPFVVKHPDAPAAKPFLKVVAGACVRAPQTRRGHVRSLVGASCELNTRGSLCVRAGVVAAVEGTPSTRDEKK